jgi:hypothetical protein
MLTVSAETLPVFGCLILYINKAMLKWMSVLLLCALAATAAEQEPSYNGRLLSEWLGDMRLGQLWAGPSPTERTVQAMGTNAIPTLLKWMSYEPSPSELSSQIEEKVPHWRPITNLNLYPAQRAQRAGAAFVQVSVLTIDTNPPPVFRRSSRNTASSQRLLPARQALRHEAEEFGVATPPEVGQRHGSKQSKSVENPQQVKVIGKASLGSSKCQS